MKTTYASIILMVLCCCASNNELEIPNNVDVANVNSDLVKAFEHLNQKIGNGDLSIENQMKVFYDYAVSRQIGLNLNNAS